jgi:hypothetical protein
MLTTDQNEAVDALVEYLDELVGEAVRSGQYSATVQKLREEFIYRVKGLVLNGLV